MWPLVSADRSRLPKAVAGTVILATFALYVFLSAPFDSVTRAVDMKAYWNAAERLRSGGDLYAGLHLYVYTYAPWFAYLWLPLTYLPEGVVEAAWLALLLVAVAWLTYPLLRSLTGVLLAALIVPQVLEYAWRGNVDALMLVGLAAVGRRAGPLLVGVAASLKITPITFVVYYLSRREWMRAATALAVAAALWIPALAFDLSAYGNPGYAAMTTPYSLLAFGPVVWIAGNLLAIGALGVVALRKPNFVLLLAAVTAMLGNPRMSLYAVGYLLIPARAAVSVPGWRHTGTQRATVPRG